MNESRYVDLLKMLIERGFVKLKDWSDFLKTILDKYGFSFIVSFFIAMLIVFFVPNAYVFITFKQENLWALAFYTIAGLVVVEFFKYIKNKLRESIFNIKSKYERQKKMAENNKRGFQKLWAAVDQLHPIEREVILELVQNGNEPIPQKPWLHFNSSRGFQCFVNEIFNKKNTLVIRLKDEKFESLERSYKEYGKISNVD